MGSQKKEKMETAVNKIHKHIEINNKSESTTENEQNESSKGCPNCEKNNKEENNEGETPENKKKDRSCMNTKNEIINEGKESGTPKEKNDQGENVKEKNISG